MSGGGSGNKGGAFSSYLAGNGGCSGNIYKFSVSLDSGTVITVTVGVGGANSVANGGNTTVNFNSTTYTAYGGKNGSLTNASSTAVTDITQSSTNDFGSSIGLLSSSISSADITKSIITSTIITSITPVKEVLSLFSNSTTQFSVSIPPLIFFIVYSPNDPNSLFYSFDGQNIISLPSSLYWYVNDIVWNSKMYILASDSGNGYSNSLSYSYDGLSWIGLGNTILDICYTLCSNNTITIASGIKNGTNTTVYSYDCLNWNFIKNQSGVNDLFIAMTTFGDKFIGFISISSSIFNISKSSNGIDWVEIAGYFGGYNFGNGSTWICPQFLQIGNKMYVATTGANILVIDKDLSVTELYPSVSTWDSHICILSNNYIVVFAGNSFTTVSPTIVYTYDFTNFYEVSNSLDLIDTPSAGCWTGKMFILTSQSTVNFTISYDGITWSNIVSSIAPGMGNVVKKIYINKNPNNQIIDTNFDFNSELFQKNNNINISFKTQSLS
jgi:hypothetical protein